MIDIAQTTLLTALLLLPGITWSLIWMKYSKTKPQTDKFYFSVYSIVASVFCYFAVCLLSKICPFFGFENNQILSIFRNENIDKYKLQIDEEKLQIILRATLIGFISGIISVIGSHKKWVIWLMNKFKITLRDGEADLWCYSLYEHIKQNKSDAFVRIYDQKRDLIYSGVIQKISEEKSEKEMVLLKVQIHKNPTGELLDETPKIYLVFDHREFFIHFLSTK